MAWHWTGDRNICGTMGWWVNFETWNQKQIEQLPIHSFETYAFNDDAVVWCGDNYGFMGMSLIINVNCTPSTARLFILNKTYHMSYWVLVYWENMSTSVLMGQQFSDMLDSPLWKWRSFKKSILNYHYMIDSQGIHDGVIKWKHYPRNWNSPVHKGQWRGALMFSLTCAWINDWVNNREAGDLRRYHAHYDVIVMFRVEIHCGAHGSKRPSNSLVPPGIPLACEQDNIHHHFTSDIYKLSVSFLHSLLHMNIYQISKPFCVVTCTLSYIFMIFIEWKYMIDEK